MKKFLVLLFSLFSIVAFSQQTVDFERVSGGATMTITGKPPLAFNNAIVSMSNDANSFAVRINESVYVFKLTDHITINNVLMTSQTAPQIVNLLATTVFQASGGSGGQLVDYTIYQVGSNYVAAPRDGTTLSSFVNTDVYTLINSAKDALTPSGSVGSGGGYIHLSKLTGSLSNEIIISGWENQGAQNPGKSELTIDGEGTYTKLTQNTSGKNGIVIKNNASVSIKRMSIVCGSGARSAIRFDGSGASEISAFEGTFDELYLESSSSSYPALYMENFFDLNFGKIFCVNTSGDAIVMSNTSTTINYGNSNFEFIRAVAASTGTFAGLKMVSTDGADYHALDMITFSNYECAVGSYGVNITDGFSITFKMVDIETVNKGFNISGGTIARMNSILAGFISVSASNGVSIDVSKGGNSFACSIGGPSTSTPIHDVQSAEPPNSYDVILWNDNSANISVSATGRTFLKYRTTNTGRTFVKVGDNWTATTPALTDNTTSLATTEFVHKGFGFTIGVQNTQSAAPANTSEDTLYAVTIPANTLGPNGVLHIIPLLNMTNNANTKTFRVRIGATAIATEALASTVAVRWYLTLSNRNSLSSQVAGGIGSISGEGFGTVSGVAIATYSFDFSSAQRLTITVQKATSGDLAALESVQVVGYY